MKVVDDVPGRRGWEFGSWQRNDGVFQVPIWHRDSSVGLWASGVTREEATTHAQRLIDDLYEQRITSWEEADPVGESVSIDP